MLLEVHDTEVGNSHVATANNIDYDYMAEQWVQDIVTDECDRKLKFPLDRFILKDESGVRAVWKIHENLDAELVEKSERFRGEWVLNYRFPPKRR